MFVCLLVPELRIATSLIRTLFSGPMASGLEELHYTVHVHYVPIYVLIANISSYFQENQTDFVFVFRVPVLRNSMTLVLEVSYYTWPIANRLWFPMNIIKMALDTRFNSSYTIFLSQVALARSCVCYSCMRY